MKRRSLIKKAAVGTLATAGAASAAPLPDADGPYTLTEVDGRRVVAPVSTLDDFETEDHCHVYCCEDCPSTGCEEDCVYETCCNL